LIAETCFRLRFGTAFRVRFGVLFVVLFFRSVDFGVCVRFLVRGTIVALIVNTTDEMSSKCTFLVDLTCLVLRLGRIVAFPCGV
jgi:hypothetical protein